MCSLMLKDCETSLLALPVYVLCQLQDEQYLSLTCSLMLKDCEMSLLALTVYMLRRSQIA